MPAEYWALSAMPCTSSGLGGWMACRTLTFSSRTSSAEKDTGGSMHSSVSSWSMWFCTRSRRAPEVS